MKNRKRRIGLRIVAAVVIVLCVILGVNKNKLDTKYEALAKQQSDLEQQIEDEKERSEEIEEYKIYITTKKFIKDFAGSVMGLVDPDDIIIKEDE